MFELDTVSTKLANIVGWLIQKIFESIVAPFADLYTVDELIFGTFESDETIYWRTFTESELANAFLPSYYLMMTVAGTMLVIFIVLAGIRIAGASMSANKRNELWEFAKELVLVGIGIYMVPTLFSLLFAINNIFVDLFSNAVGTDIFALNQTIGENDSLGEAETGIIGKVIINFILVGIGIWANFYYLMRKITLLILMPLAPVMIVCWMFPAWKGLTLTYFRELSGTIFVQAIHAFTFWTVASISNAETGLIATIIGYMIFIPISEQIKGILGLSTNMVGGLNRAGSMMGMAALAGVYGSAKGAMKGNGVMDSLRSLKDGGKKLASDLKDGKGLDSFKDIVGTAKEAAFASAKSMDMEKFGDLVSQGGKAVGGLAGTFVGSPMGPLATVGFAEALSKGGGMIGGVGGRVGFAATDKLKSMFGDGKQALEDKENFDEVKEFAKSVASGQAASWASGSKEQIMNDLRAKFPTAGEAELAKKFDTMVGEKAKGITQDTKQLFDDAKLLASEKGDSSQLIAAGAKSMANAWQKENGAEFIKDWKANNPMKPNETPADYNKRANEAMLDEKMNKLGGFMRDGEMFARNNADANGKINRNDLANHMANSAKSHNGMGNFNVNDLLNGVKSDTEGISGLNILKPGANNANDLIANLAEARTNQVGKARVQELMDSKGLSEMNAKAIWNTERPQALANSLAEFDTPNFRGAIGQAADLTAKKSDLYSGGTVGTFVQGAIAKDGQNISASMDALKAGVNDGAHAFVANMKAGEGIFQSAAIAKTASTQAFGSKVLDHFGNDAIQAEQSIVQGAGYMAGIIGGASGRSAAQNIALKALHGSTVGNAVQSQISNASEILQMAHKVPDENGNMQIAPGAIRQVTTRDKSFVEIRTASGEVKTVSRIGAGSESLKNGETVYQDLTTSDGNTLEVAKVGRSQVSTYRMDTGNSKIPVAHDVQNPMSLIGTTGGSHAEINQGYRAMPVLSEKVDSGKFYREDIGKAVFDNNLSNLQVVTTKGEQYLTAMNAEGQQVRLSPVMKGDARLGANEVVATPVRVSKKGEVTATKIQKGLNGMLNGVGSKIITTDQVRGDVEIQESIVNAEGQPSQRATVQRNVVVSKDTVGQAVQKVNETIAVGAEDSYDYVMPYNLANENVASFNNLLASKHDERVRRGLGKREVAEQIRKKQGRP